MRVELGRHFIQYYSLAQRFANKVQTIVMNRARKMAAVPGMSVNYEYSEEELKLKEFAGDSDHINSEIWFDLQCKTLSERASDYAADNIAHEYESPIPDFHWRVLSDSESSVLGYRCFKATCRFKGRNWSVWFTPEIPLPYGPWKFCGLPGLILKAEDDQEHYCWECCSFEQCAEPMIYYKIPTRKCTISQFKTWLTHLHNHPYEAIDKGRGTTLIQTYDKGKLVDLDDSWTLPYNPIELE